MIWYIFTLLFVITGTVTGVQGVPRAVECLFIPQWMLFFSVVGILVSVWVTLYSISAQKSEKIALDKEKVALKTAFNELKIVEKDYEIKGKFMLNHELEIIKSLGLIMKEGSTEIQGENVMSHNLLAQLPELKGLSNMKYLIECIGRARNYVVQLTNRHNHSVVLLRNRQENPLIYSPFVPKYKVSFIEDTFEEEA